MGVDLGHSVGVDLGHSVGHWGSLDLHGLCSLNSNWGSGVDIGDVVGNGGNSSLHGSNWGNTNIGSRNQMGNGVGNGSSHNSLADRVNKTILVQIFGEALECKGAKALGGLDCVSKGRSEGANWRRRRWKTVFLASNSTTLALLPVLWIFTSAMALPPTDHV